MDTDLIYGIDDRPPLKETLFAAIQHLLAIFVAIITPPLIIAGALKLDLETTGFLVSMALFASGVSTFVQCRKLGPVGAGPRNQLLVYRPDYHGWFGGRASPYFRRLYRRLSGRDDREPYF